MALVELSREEKAALNPRRPLLLSERDTREPSTPWCARLQAFSLAVSLR
jgi:hypothetical protein